MARSFVQKVVFVVAGLLLAGILGSYGWLKGHYVVPIITYHHIGEASGKGLNLNTVSVKVFEQQMGYLKEHGYQVIPFAELARGIKDGRSFKPGTVVIQFDDGYEDNYTYAYPVLKRYGLPAMVFLVSDLIGQGQGFLAWEQVQEMEKAGFLAGAHTRHHVYLPDLPVEKARDEIAGSKRVIEDHLGHPIDYFAYPSGGFTPQHKEMAQDAGFQAAVTTNRGRARLNQDLFELKRVRIKDSDHSLILWAKLSGYYNLLRSDKNGY